MCEADRRCWTAGRFAFPWAEHRPGGFVLWHRGAPGPGTFRESWLDQEPGSQMGDLRKGARPQASASRVPVRCCVAGGTEGGIVPRSALRDHSLDSIASATASGGKHQWA